MKANPLLLATMLAEVIGTPIETAAEDISVPQRMPVAAVQFTY